MNRLNIICFSVNKWGKRRARKHQFMLQLAKQEEIEKVIYIEPPLNFIQLIRYFLDSKSIQKEDKQRYQRALKNNFISSHESEKLLLFTPIFFFPFAYKIQWAYNINLFFLQLVVKASIKKLNLKNIILWIYHPFAYKLLDWFKERLVSWFDWAEDWKEYYFELSKARRKRLGELENLIIKNADIVSTVSSKLLERARIINENSFRLKDGTVINVFIKAGSEIPDDIKNIKKPILGYLGSVTERIDLELIEFLVEKLPNVSIVFIGNIIYPRADIPRLRKIKNTYLLGGKKYEELGIYTKEFDVSILPYITDLWVFPTKLFDYFAIGSPIVTTSVPDLEPYKDVVRIAHTKEEFVMHVQKSLEENVPLMVEKRLKVAKENSWENRAKQILETIKNYRSTK